MKKRVIAWMLALMMALGQIPATALAAEIEPETVAVVEEETTAVVEETEDAEEIEEEVAAPEEITEEAVEETEAEPATEAAPEKVDLDAATSTPLATPTGLKIDGFVYGWNAVDKALYYELDIEVGGQKGDTDNIKNTWDVADGETSGDMTELIQNLVNRYCTYYERTSAYVYVSVFAVPDWSEEGYTSSEKAYFSPMTCAATGTVNVMPTASNIQYNNYVLSWDPIENAGYYLQFYYGIDYEEYGELWSSEYRWGEGGSSVNLGAVLRSYTSRYVYNYQAKTNEKLAEVPFKIAIRVRYEGDWDSDWDEYPETSKPAVGASFSFKYDDCKLKTPQNLKLEGNNLSWDPVPGNPQYTVALYVSDDAYNTSGYGGRASTTETQLDISDLLERECEEYESAMDRLPVEMCICVKAAPVWGSTLDDEEYIESNWSEPLLQDIEGGAERLGEVKNLRWNNTTLSWDAVSGADGYVIYIDCGGNDFSETVSVCVDQTSCDLIQYLAEAAEKAEAKFNTKLTTYRVRVCAEAYENGYAPSIWSEADPLVISEDTTALPAPGNLKINDYKVSWSAVTGASGYLITYGVTGDYTISSDDRFMFENTWSITKTSMDLKSAVRDLRKNYFIYYGVSPRNLYVKVVALSGDITKFRNSASASLPDQNVYGNMYMLDVPKNLKRNGYEISWDKVPNAPKYRIYIRVAENAAEMADYNYSCDYVSATENKKDIQKSLEQTVLNFCNKWGLESAYVVISVVVDDYESDVYVVDWNEDEPCLPGFTMAKPADVTQNVITVNEAAVAKVMDASAKNQTYSIGATNLGGVKMTYASSNSAVKVSTSGVVTVAKNFAGTALIQITAPATSKYLAATKMITLTVNPVITVKDLTVNASAFDKTHTLGASVTGKSVLEYACSDERITIDEKGMVNVPAFVTGTATITVKAKVGETVMDEETVTLTINELADNTITTAEDAFTRYYSPKAQTITLDPQVLGKAKVTYVSSDSKKVKVSAAGKVTIPAKYQGTATITMTTAETGEYYPATRTVTLEVLPAENTIKIAPVVKKLSTKDQIVQLKAAANNKPAITYSLVGSAPEGITVTATGKLTIPAGFVGNATVKIESAEVVGYHAASIELPVTVAPAAPALKAVNAAPVTLNLSWPAVAGAEKYVVQYSIDNKFTEGNYYEVETTELTKQLTELDQFKGKTVFVRVKSCAGAGDGAVASTWSAVKKVKVAK